MDYRPYQGVELTEAGEEAALRVLRNHRLVELFLVRTLGFTWDEVHIEAERLEHAMSDKLADRIDAFLGFPRVDPHGDPIPTRDGRIEPTAGQPLHALAEGDAGVIERVLDQDPDLLRYLDGLGLRPGARVTLDGADPFDGPLHLTTLGGKVAISRSVGERLLVRADAHDEHHSPTEN